MIDIPEERILKEITDILMNDLPKVLLELEEQSEDSIRLPPFRYVGLEENLSPGTGLPYAFVEIEEVNCSLKDRIIRNRENKIRVKLLLVSKQYFLKYSHCVNKTLKECFDSWKIMNYHMSKSNQSADFVLKK
mgnify:CR=1 FL=1